MKRISRTFELTAGVATSNVLERVLLPDGEVSSRSKDIFEPLEVKEASRLPPSLGADPSARVVGHGHCF